MHWADVAAKALSHKGTKHIVSTGITPSGEFHIGHLREILTGDMIATDGRQQDIGAGRGHRMVGGVRCVHT